MNAAGKLAVAMGAVGAVAGAGYLVWRHFKKRARKEAGKATTSTSADATGATRTTTGATSTSTGATSTSTAAMSASADANTTSTAVTTTSTGTTSTNAAAIPASTDAAAPIADPRTPLAHIPINWSHIDADGTVIESADRLLEQARKFDASITVDELTGARLAASEHHRGSFAELACIVDAELNRAERRGMSLYQSLTHEGTFGKQGSKRRASTRQDPKLRHLWAARAVLSGKARGISQGAERFFDPKAMDAMHTKYKAWLESGRKGKQPPAVSCDALTLLEAWSFDLGRQGSSRCPPDRSKPGSHPQAWVGPIPGVDAVRLMLMKPLPTGPEHTAQYEAARQTLRQGLAKAKE